MGRSAKGRVRSRFHSRASNLPSQKRNTTWAGEGLPEPSPSVFWGRNDFRDCGDCWLMRDGRGSLAFLMAFGGYAL
jgi:hypothetical protein